MPFSLALLVLPLCLQKDAREVIAGSSRSYLLKIVEKNPQLLVGFQLIVTEHANLRDQWFQDSLVEQPWTKPPALVPEDWPLMSKSTS